MMVLILIFLIALGAIGIVLRVRYEDKRGSNPGDDYEITEEE